MTRLAPLAILVVAAACARTINPVPVPVAGVPIQTWSEQVREPRARDIYMRNDSDGEIVITGVQLYNCRNIRQECRAYQTNVVIAPGQTVKAMRLEPENLKLSWHYNYNFQMRRNGRSVAMPGPVMTETFTVIAPGNSPGLGTALARVSDFQPAVDPHSRGEICSAQNPVPGPDGTRGLAAVYGTTDEDLRMVTVYRRTDGTPVQLVDTRNGPDGRRTAISTMLERRIAFIRNVGADGVAHLYHVSGADVLSAPTLGDPQAIVAHVLERCGK